MKIAFVFAIVAFSTTLLYGQQKPTEGAVRMSAGEDVHHAKLRLTTSIVDEQVCLDNRIRYSLLFKFTNLGEETVIVGRFRPVVSRYMVSVNEKAALTRKYEVDAHRLIGLDNDLMSSYSVLDESRFVSLKRGASYEVKEEFSLSITGGNGKSLRPGGRMLQVVVATWYHPRESNIEWREKLRDKGYLWSDSLVSDPMFFVIPRRTSGSDCR